MQNLCRRAFRPHAPLTSLLNFAEIPASEEAGYSNLLSLALMLQPGSLVLNEREGFDPGLFCNSPWLARARQPRDSSCTAFSPHNLQISRTSSWSGRTR
jgi:hypothetical protein